MDADQLDLLHRLVPMLSDAKSLPYALTRIDKIIPPDSEDSGALSPLLDEVRGLHRRLLERESLTEVGWYGFTPEEQQEAKRLANHLKSVL